MSKSLSGACRRKSGPGARNIHGMLGILPVVGVAVEQIPSLGVSEIDDF